MKEKPMKKRNFVERFSFGFFIVGWLLFTYFYLGYRAHQINYNFYLGYTRQTQELILIPVLLFLLYISITIVLLFLKKKLSLLNKVFILSMVGVIAFYVPIPREYIKNNVWRAHQIYYSEVSEKKVNTKIIGSWISKTGGNSIALIYNFDQNNNFTLKYISPLNDTLKEGFWRYKNNKIIIENTLDSTTEEYRLLSIDDKKIRMIRGSLFNGYQITLERWQ